MTRRAMWGMLAALAVSPAAGQGLPILLFFEPHSARIEDGGLELLRGMAADAARARGQVEIRGFADPEGGLPYNRALSLARAEHVAHQLREFGVPGERLRIVARGPVTPVMDDQESRRVEVRLRP